MTKWWQEPISWQQANAIEKHHSLNKGEAELIYPTKGEAIGAIKASYFKKCLEHAKKDVVWKRLTDFKQLRTYFIDDSEGGENHLGKRSLEKIWEYLKTLSINLS